MEQVSDNKIFCNDYLFMMDTSVECVLDPNHEGPHKNVYTAYVHRGPDYEAKDVLVTLLWD